MVRKQLLTISDRDELQESKIQRSSIERIL